MLGTYLILEISSNCSLNIFRWVSVTTSLLGRSMFKYYIYDIHTESPSIYDEMFANISVLNFQMHLLFENAWVYIHLNFLGIYNINDCKENRV